MFCGYEQTKYICHSFDVGCNYFYQLTFLSHFPVKPRLFYNGYKALKTGQSGQKTSDFEGWKPACNNGERANSWFHLSWITFCWELTRCKDIYGFNRTGIILLFSLHWILQCFPIFMFLLNCFSSLITIPIIPSWIQLSWCWNNQRVVLLNCSRHGRESNGCL